MKLVKLSNEEISVDRLYEMRDRMEGLLKEGEVGLSLEELLSIQSKDGSFSLVSSKRGIPNEAIIDFIHMPTYLGAAILMKEYVAGNTAVTTNLQQALKNCVQTQLRGHGYEVESMRIEIMQIFLLGELPQFLQVAEELEPRFHQMIHNLLYSFHARLIRGKTTGPWGEDYAADWRYIVEECALERRLYIAYGSNMNQAQMADRCPDARLVGKAYLEDWKLTMPFYANIEKEKAAKTPVLIWDISEKDEISLDYYEGYPDGYEKEELIIDVNGRRVSAMAYIMTEQYKKADNQARAGYVESILQGYEEAGFSKEEFIYE